jgi:hypothetical protein
MATPKGGEVGMVKGGNTKVRRRERGAAVGFEKSGALARPVCTTTGMLEIPMMDPFIKNINVSIQTNLHEKWNFLDS